MSDPRQVDVVPPRYELKYIVDDELIMRVRQRIQDFCARDPYARADGSYDIYSLYLDDAKFTTHVMKRHRVHTRFKLRLRTYGPGTLCIAEVKRRVGDRILKTRVRVGEDLEEVLYPDEDASAHHHDFAQLAHRMGAEPTVLVRYSREAWVSQVDDYARVTFDGALEYQPKTTWDFDVNERAWMAADDGGVLGSKGSLRVLELKFGDSAPQWMADLSRDLDLWRVGFSKYCTGVDKLYGRFTPFRPHRAIST